MFISEMCPEWFWLIPLLGMVLMFAFMFLICGKGVRNGITGMCGHNSKQYRQGNTDHDNRQAPGTNKQLGTDSDQ